MRSGHYKRTNKYGRYVKRLTAVAAAGVVTLSGCGMKAPESVSDIAMDTLFTVTLYGEEIASEELMDCARELDEKVLSRYSEDSFVSMYMRGEADGEYVYGNTDLKEILDMCEDIRVSSAGAFDVNIGALEDLWDIENCVKEGKELIVPDAGQIEGALEDRSILDLGAVGKGIYLDEAYEMLEASGIQGAVISSGGSILVYGSKYDGSDFRVGIRDPFSVNSQRTFGILEISGGYFISTSGSYERYAEHDGVRYHHVLDPATGYPAWTPEDISARQTIPAYALSSPAPGTESYPVSVTVICKSGFMSDALSTACFVMGPDMGVGYAENNDAHVIFIMNDGTVITSRDIIQSDGKEKVFTIPEK